MKNIKGFTLVEVISVIVLLGLIVGISVPIIMTTSTNIRKKGLQSKVENIEQAAVLYGQNNRGNFNEINCSFCTGITGECVCYSEDIDEDGTDDEITVGYLASEGYMKYDDGTTDVVNPVDDTKSLKSCEIQIYKKYGKIYAVYIAKDTNDTVCWWNTD